MFAIETIEMGSLGESSELIKKDLKIGKEQKQTGYKKPTKKHQTTTNHIWILQIFTKKPPFLYIFLHL